MACSVCTLSPSLSVCLSPLSPTLHLPHPPIHASHVVPLNLWGCVSGDLRRLRGGGKQTRGGGGHQGLVLLSLGLALICPAMTPMPVSSLQGFDHCCLSFCRALSGTARPRARRQRSAHAASLAPPQHELPTGRPSLSTSLCSGVVAFSPPPPPTTPRPVVPLEPLWLMWTGRGRVVRHGRRSKGRGLGTREGVS
jgi:hypothetical protein